MNSHPTTNTHGLKSTLVDKTYSTLLIEKLSPHLEFHDYPIGHRISFSAANQANIYVFRSGVTSVHRQPNDVLIEVVEAPTLRGILPIHAESSTVYIVKAVTPIVMSTIPRTQFYELLDTLQLWEPFARHLQLVGSMAAEVIFKVTSPSVFDVVRFQLYELMEKSEATREGLPVESYIREKTRVSRSAIMRVLSELKNGGYIIIENGILKEIKHIPTRF